MSDPNEPTPHFNEVMEADDVTKTVTGTQDITEPLGASKGMTRVVTVVLCSVCVGWKILTSITYQHPPSSESWGAIQSLSYSEEEL